MPFGIDFTDSALGDLAVFNKHDQVRILDRVAVQLTHQPTTETRHRKPLEPNSVSEWELRIGTFRVFYDVNADAGTVKIKLIGFKQHNKLYVRGKEYAL